MDLEALFDVAWNRFCALALCIRVLHTLQSESFTEIMLFSIFEKTIPGLFALHFPGFRHSPRQDC